MKNFFKTKCFLLTGIAMTIAIFLLIAVMCSHDVRDFGCAQPGDTIQNTTLNNAGESTNALAITISNDSKGAYLGGDDQSYNSPYEDSKCHFVIQFYTTTGTLVASKTAKIADSELTCELDYGTYIVRILAPTYMHYTITYLVDDTKEISLSANTFAFVWNGAQSLVVKVEGIADNSWLSFFGE